MPVLKTIGNKLHGFFEWFKQASFKKKLGVSIITLLFLYLITSPLRVKPVQYQTAVVTRQTIQEIVSESGNIAANGQTEIVSDATGVITALNVSNGMSVTAGETLFKVKATATPQEQAGAYANYINAVSSLQTEQNTSQSLDATMWSKQQAFLTAQDTQNYMIGNPSVANPATGHNYTNIEKLAINNNVIQTQKDFSAAEQAYTTANIAVAAAQASVTSTHLAYEATKNETITSPVSGVVENLAFGLGDNITADTTLTDSGTTTNPNASPVLYIVTDGTSDNALAVVQVNEVDYPKIKIGQKAVVTLPALPDKQYSGHIVRIDSLGTNNSSVISFNVYIKLDNPSSNIAPNMTVNVNIYTAKHTGALTVPNSAIKPYKGASAVVVYDKNKPASKQLQYVPVTVGIKGIYTTEILSGVSQGAVVVTGSATPQTVSGPFGN